VDGQAEYEGYDKPWRCLHDAMNSRMLA